LFRHHYITYPNTIAQPCMNQVIEAFIHGVSHLNHDSSSKSTISFSTRRQEHHLCKQNCSTSWMSSKYIHVIIKTWVYTLHKYIEVEYMLVWEPIGCFIRSRVLRVHIWVKLYIFWTIKRNLQLTACVTN
jgi:hypothetical protein